MLFYPSIDTVDIFTGQTTLVLGADISVTINTSPYHSEYDWIGNIHTISPSPSLSFSFSPTCFMLLFIGMFVVGDCPDQGNICYYTYQYVPEGAHSEIVFAGIPYLLKNLVFRYYLTGDIIVADDFEVTIEGKSTTRTSTIPPIIALFVSTLLASSPLIPNIF